MKLSELPCAFEQTRLDHLKTLHLSVGDVSNSATWDDQTWSDSVLPLVHSNAATLETLSIRGDLVEFHFLARHMSLATVDPSLYLHMPCLRALHIDMVGKNKIQ